MYGHAILQIALLVLLVNESVKSEILTPPYFNLAEGRKITATATCGVDTEGPELYCKLVGTKSENDVDVNVIQGQFCDVCDTNKPDKMHPPEFAVDGMETWWQSPPLSRGMKYNKVNLTIDLGQEFHVAYVYIRMGNSPRPGLWVLEKSADYGKTYVPWQYFSDSAVDCETHFGPESLEPISKDDSVICSTEYSNILPLEGGEIPISLLINRPSANHYFNSTVLQEWTRATNVRLRFLRTKNFLGHLMSVAKQDHTVTRRYFYSIKDISIGGRCMCNGHADTCDVQNPEDPSVLLCRCQHNTCGAKCNSCCPGYLQKAWRQSKVNEPFICEPCNCFLHSNECSYDLEVDRNHLSLDIFGLYEGGGVCQNCQHNTQGINCNQCLPKYYRPYGKNWNETDVCHRCQCDNFYSTGNCSEGVGKCECRKEYQSPDCDKCSFGYFGYPGCKPCECNLNGTIGLQCESQNGRCTCRANFGGDYCKECAPGFYNYPECKRCKCNSEGSVSSTCDQDSGNCTCKNNYAGQQCDVCQNGNFGFPNCAYCSCDLKGTEEEICNKENGQCFCKEGYSGERCDTCEAGYYGYPDCQPCNCGKLGSLSKDCNAAGRCSCLVNYAGKTCELCSPGYFNYSECSPCDCNSRGSNGVSCDSEGKCECHYNFANIKCDSCKEGFYNFPACEDCNCHPAGVVAGFAGCGSVPAGELCQCKERVEGRICNKCKPLYWNLNVNNPHGCEECNCNAAGTLGSISVCNTESGQCVCKPSVIARGCSECADGTYHLEEDNLFGCTDCECDIGGSINGICDKLSGQCVCQSRVTGRTCKEPLQMHYFPTLYQYQYEVEDGHTPSNTSVRYFYDEKVFPGYSWKGYGVFSALQNEILQDIYVSKSSLYLMILKYVNRSPETVIGTIRIFPESTYEVEQKQQVQFKTSHEPTFVTVSGSSGTTPTPFVINPGKWTVSIHVPKGLFVDYFVLLPEDFYLASILNQKVEKPCKVNENGLCREYSYPNLTQFDTVLFEFGQAIIGHSREEISEFYDDATHLPQVNVKSKIPIITSTQPGLTVDLRINKPSLYVILINYVTPLNNNGTHKLNVNITGNFQYSDAHVVLYSCTYKLLCRQAVITRGEVGVFQVDKDRLIIGLSGNNSNVGLHSVTAIPYEDWSLDYITPKPKCINKDGFCIQSTFMKPQETKKIVFEASGDELSKNKPSLNFNITSYVLLNSTNQFVDLRGKVPSPGFYVFIVHYYQPSFPEFSINVLIQNGQFYEAKVPLKHCPSQSGCRSVVTEASGNFRFNLIENFMITFKEPGNKHAFLYYILVVPSDFYNPQNLEEEDFDQTGEFIKTCGSNNFNIDTTVEGFCRDSVFSITAAHNGGARLCQCNYDGSLSFKCDKFGGQCYCKDHVIGRKCEACKTGYYGFPDCKPCNCPSTAYCDPNEGRCICPPRVTGERCDQCMPFTYGYDPIIGCDECNCDPLGVESNLQCDLLNGMCSCKPNIVGRRCTRCLAGHYSFPYCDSCDCDTRGTLDGICDAATAECLCKKNVIGPACTMCREGTFHLQASNDIGCTECFCFGKSTRCTSSKLITVSLIEMSDWSLCTVNFTSKLEVAPINKTIQTGEDVGIDFTSVDFSNKTVYFATPADYLGKRLHSYGGYLNYTIFYTIDQKGSAVSGPDVILEGNNTFLIYSSVEQPPPASEYTARLQLVETNFELPVGLPAKREHIMEVLRDLRGIYIRGKYWTDSITTRLSKVSLDEGISYEFYNDNFQDIVYSHNVEQCQCPPNYQGLSCEDCSPGYYRLPIGPHGGYCVPCVCNGHATECDTNTGVCFNCTHNTRGDNCELCDIGYHGNAHVGTPRDCLICACPLPVLSNNFATACDVSSDGEKISCECEYGYVGAKCESCAPGFYGQPQTLGDYCKPCQCSGNINPNDPKSCDTVNGQCEKCLNNTSGVACSLCAPGYFGDAVTLKDCQSCICDKTGTQSCNSYSGTCICKENVIGDKCDTCAYEHYGFQSGDGCTACLCGIASDSNQCDDFSGQCKCKDGVSGRQCDKCAGGHWNYTIDGCESCGCKSDYSVGFGCNALTGQCECLQGVMGEKCDQCPYRWAFVPDYGCHECDSCTHALLDSTDSLSKLIDPVILEFDTTHSGYFTLKRLDNMRDLLNELRPKFDEVDPRQITMNATLDELQSLEADSKNLNRKTNYSLENSELLKKDADKLAEKGRNIFMDLLQTEDSSNLAIQKINDIIKQLDEGNGPEINAAVQEGQQILNAMKLFDVTKREVDALEQLDKANQLLDNVTDFKQPVDDLNKRVIVLETDLKDLTAKLDDLYNNTQYSWNKALEAENIIEKSGIESLKKKLDNIENQTLASKKNLLEAEDLNKNSSKLLENTRAKVNPMQYAPDTIGTVITDLNSTLEVNEKGIDEIDMLIPVVEKHANETTDKLQELENLLSETQYISGDALKAANAYKDILAAVQSAREAAESADEDAINVVESLSGINDITYGADQNSSSVLSQAHDLHSSASEDLQPLLDDAKEQFEPVNTLHLKNEDKFKEIEKSIKNVGIVSLDEVFQNATVDAEYASEHIAAITDKFEHYFEELPKQKDQAKLLPKELDDASRNMQQTEKQLNSINEKLPLLIETINNLPEKQRRLQQITQNLQQNLNKLNQQVALARDLANRIEVGVRFYRNTTLELRNPHNIEDLSTSTKISGYFNTTNEFGLLWYLGNPKGTNLRRTESDDYMALVIQNGYPVLKLDLGNGPETVISKKYVADGNWYQFIIERTGFNAKLSIIEELRNGTEDLNVAESVLEGPYSIFNLDKNKSKLFVGGIPAHYAIQEPIDDNSFDGEIEGLQIGDLPVSLWNFNNGYENNHGCKKRNKLLNLLSSTGFRFNGNGYVVLNGRSYSLRKRSDIQLKFKTYATEGLLFLAEKDNTFLALELRNGKILYQYNLGSETKLWYTTRTFNDGQWHTISASQDGPRGQLTVDDEYAVDRTKQIQGNYLNPIEVLSFGGYPGKHSYKEVTNTKFDGCIDGVVIAGGSVDLKQSIKAYDVTPGCPDKVARMVSFSKNRGGFVRQSPLSVSNNFKLNLKFKTKEKDGLIFYATNQDQTEGISLALTDGHLKLISQKTELISKDLYNDSDWHVISIMHNNQLRIDFDDYDNLVTDAPPTYLHILYGNLYIGGLPRRVTAAPGMVGSTESFYGCIGDVTLNGNVINFANCTERSNEILGKCTLDTVQIDENPDVHNVPKLPPLQQFDKETTLSPDAFTENPFATPSTIRGDGGRDEEPLNPVTEPIITIGKVTSKPNESNKPTRGPVGTVPPTTKATPKVGCALPINVSQESEENDSFQFGTQKDGRLVYSEARGKIRKQSELYLEFKSTEEDGILFYASDQTATLESYMALFLQNGRLIYTFSNGVNSVIVPSTKTYNDGAWHMVFFKREDGDGILEVDGEVTSVRNEMHKLELRAPFYIGGLAPVDYNFAFANLNTTASFKGCIRNFLMNRKPMTKPEKTGVIPCSDNVEPGTFFYGSKTSYIKLKEKFHVGDTFDVKLDIKPRIETGILIAVHGKKDYFVLEMVNGSMKLTAENGLGPITAVFEPKTPYYFCDGNWHTIQAVKSKNVVTLSVDGIFTDPKLGDHRAVSTSTGSGLFLGGHRFLSSTKKVRGFSSHQAYVGCVKKVFLNNDYVHLVPSMAHGNISVGSCRTN